MPADAPDLWAGVGPGLMLGGPGWHPGISRRKGGLAREYAADMAIGGLAIAVSAGEGSVAVARGRARRSAHYGHEPEALASGSNNAQSCSAIRAGRWHWLCGMGEKIALGFLAKRVGLSAVIEFSMIRQRPG